MASATPREPATRRPVLRRMAIKFVILGVVMTIVVTVGEMLLFHFAARNGWLMLGPQPAWSPADEAWQSRFGELPPEAEHVVAPFATPSGRPQNGDGQAVPQEVPTDSGLIMYSFGAGPRVPSLFFPNFVWSPREFLSRIREGFEVRRTAVTGLVHVSSDGRFWCEVGTVAPFYIRTREYVGIVDESLPPSSARGWKTSCFSWAGLTYSVAFLLITFGWMFFIPEMRIGFQRYRAGRHRKRGLCEACGYDLQGHKDGRCPECGNAMTGR